MGVNSLPKTVTRLRRVRDLNPAPSVPESSTLTTRLPSHPQKQSYGLLFYFGCVSTSYHPSAHVYLNSDGH